MHIPHSNHITRPPQGRYKVADNGDAVTPTPHPLLIPLAFGLALVLAVTGLVALVIFQCRARKRKIKRRQRHMSGESFTCAGEEEAAGRPLARPSQPRTQVHGHAPSLDLGKSPSPTFATPPPAYTDTIPGPAVLTTAMSLTLPRTLVEDPAIRPRALSLPDGGQPPAPRFPNVGPSSSLLDLISAAGLRNSIHAEEVEAHTAAQEHEHRRGRSLKCTTHGTAELEVVSSYASDDDEEGNALPVEFTYPVLSPAVLNEHRASVMSSELAYLQDDVEASDTRRNTRFSWARSSRHIPPRSNTNETAMSTDSDLLTRLTPEPMTPLSAEPGSLRSSWAFPGQDASDAPRSQRRLRYSIAEPQPIKFDPPPRPIRERSTTAPPDGAILHHLVNPIYNPAVARSAKGHRRSRSSGSHLSTSSTASGPPLALSLGMIGLGLTLGATLQNGTGLKRLSLVPEEDNIPADATQTPDRVYIPTATRTVTGMHRRSQTMPSPRPVLSVIPPDSSMIHHQHSPSGNSVDTSTESSHRSSSPMFFSPLLSTPSTSTTGPETPVFSYIPASPQVRTRSATVDSTDSDLTVKIYYSASGQVDPTRNSYFDSGIETVKFRLPRTAVFGELCIKAWEKLGVAVKLLMYEDMMVEGDGDIEGFVSAKRKEVGAEEWRNVCERPQSRVYFLAQDADVRVESR